MQAKPASPFRAPPIPAADVDGAGRVVAVWQDCRFHADCAANDVVFSRSSDGTTWSAPVRATRNRNAVMPTIGVEPGTGRLAIAYYALRPDGVDAELVTSQNGSSWSSPQRLNPRRMKLTWMPEHDARPHARRLHRRHVVTRPAARDLCARLAAAEREAAPGDLRRARLNNDATTLVDEPAGAKRTAFRDFRFSAARSGL